MATNWISAAPGIRYRTHPTRKHGARLDRYFTLRFSVAGKQVEEALGWASEGWSVKLAQEKLGELRKARRTGQGHATLREEAEASRRQRHEKAEAEAAMARQRRTVADLWDRYGKEVVAIENKPSTIAEKNRIWTRRVEPAIGHLKITDVTEEDAGTVVRAPLRLDSGGQVIGGKAEAGNVYRLLHHMFQKALLWRLRPKEAGNPLEGVTEPKVNRRERLLTGGEIGALITALDAAETDGTEYSQAVAVIRAAILTGGRISELLTLRWQNIRREEMELHLPDTKTGFSRRPISAAALAVLDGVERMPGVEFVFRALKTPTAPLAYNTAEKAFRRIAGRAGVERCTLHTIRHWFTTMTANSVSNARVGMALTGHKSHVAYMNYIHGDKEQARALAEELALLTNRLATTSLDVASMRKAG
ncbi:MAG TPA: site-specific integrase [Steroidobacteraceae bacterium]|nr:site-specific integrase [Steroidobacteraceae bacterium]